MAEDEQKQPEGARFLRVVFTPTRSPERRLQDSLMLHLMAQRQKRAKMKLGELVENYLQWMRTIASGDERTEAS